MSDIERFSSAQIAARLVVSRETVNGYALALESLIGVSRKGAGGKRLFSADDLALLRRAKARLRETSGESLEAALRWALETPVEFEGDDPSLEPLLALRAERVALESLRGDLRDLERDLRELPALRVRLEATVDDCGNALQAMGATVASWPVRLERIEALLKSLERTELEGQRRVVRLDEVLERFERRLLERAVIVWLVCGAAAYVLGFVALPWIAGWFARR